MGAMVGEYVGRGLRRCLVGAGVVWCLVALPSRADISLTYTYDSNGNRLAENAGSSVAAPSNLAVSTSSSTLSQTVYITGQSMSATSHITANATGGTPPYLFQWNPVPGSGSGAAFTLANSNCGTGAGVCGAGMTTPTLVNDTAILTSSCGTGLLCTNLATWSVQVTDQAGNTASATVALSHYFQNPPS